MSGLMSSRLRRGSVMPALLGFAFVGLLIAQIEPGCIPPADETGQQYVGLTEDDVRRIVQEVLAEQQVAGRQGPEGEAGQDCWDLNGNGQPDAATEDVNQDGAVNALDCRGAQGLQGQAGDAGTDCWDLNGDGVGNLATEDVNHDGAVDVRDCQGQQGQQGLQGSAGRNCWDLDGDGSNDPDEDTNHDGHWDALDCQGQAISLPLSPADGGTGKDTSHAAGGSILRTISQGVWDALTPGSNGQVLTIIGGTPAWSNVVDPNAAGTVTSVGAGLGIWCNPNPITKQGTVAIDPNVVPQLAGANTFTGVNELSNTHNRFTGYGTGLIDLNASNLSTGTLPSGRLYGTYSNSLAFTDPNNTFTGKGSGLTNLNASAISSGLLSPGCGGTGLNTSATAKGSLLYTSAQGQWTTLGPGPNEYVLKMAGGVPTWSSAPDPNGGGTVTSISPGLGILCTPNPITTTGTVSIDPNVVPQLNGANTFAQVNTFTKPPKFAATSGAPFDVLSNQTLVPNLNADLLDGQHGSFYQNATSLISGTLPDGRLYGTYSNPLTFSNQANDFTGNGSGLTSLNASNLASGTVPDGRLSANVPLLYKDQTFTGVNTFSKAPAFTQTGAPPFAVSSSSKVDKLNADYLDDHGSTYYLNASNLNDGTLSDERLSQNVVLVGNAQTIAGTKTFNAAPKFTATGAPFQVTSSTVVGNLNADMLDGNHASAFATASHNHWGQTWSASGVGLTLDSSNNSALVGYGPDEGLMGVGKGSADGVGVVGRGNNLSSWYVPSAGCGVAGTGYRFGVYGMALSSSTSDTPAGGWFQNGKGAYAYVAYTSTGGVNYKIMGSSGNATVKETSRGYASLISPESPEAWFQDYGTGVIRNGRAHVELDPLFLECVTIDEEHPMKVFVTPTSPIDSPFYVSRGQTGFDVVVVGGHTQEGTFDYLVVCKWKDMEHVRFDQVDGPASTTRMTLPPGQAPAEESEAPDDSGHAQHGFAGNDANDSQARQAASAPGAQTVEPHDGRTELATQRDRIAALQRENCDLKARLETLERLVGQLVAGDAGAE